jgi:hypothetical protein
VKSLSWLSRWTTATFVCHFLLGDIVLEAFIMFRRLEVGEAVVVNVLGPTLSLSEALGCSCSCGSSVFGRCEPCALLVELLGRGF